LKELGCLPKNARVALSDSKLMHAKIDTDRGLEVIRQFLEELKDSEKLPCDGGTG
jgi:hypothetical protein